LHLVFSTENNGFLRVFADLFLRCALSPTSATQSSIKYAFLLNETDQTALPGRANPPQVQHLAGEFCATRGMSLDSID
jgi:hypothetical protein